MKPKVPLNFRNVETNPVRRHSHEENSYKFFCTADGDNGCLNNSNI